MNKIILIIFIILIIILYLKKRYETFKEILILKVKKAIDKKRGLMFVKNPLKYNHGLLFDFGSYVDIQFWMKNTFIPLDIIYLDHNYKVIEYKENLIPLSEKMININKKFRYAIEVNAGTIKNNNIKKNDYINLKFVDNIK
jgi:uncharacterized protein